VRGRQGRRVPTQVTPLPAAAEAPAVGEVVDGPLEQQDSPRVVSPKVSAQRAVRGLRRRRGRLSGCFRFACLACGARARAGLRWSFANEGSKLVMRPAPATRLSDSRLEEVTGTDVAEGGSQSA
jgi:hypothetical protein